MTWGETGTCWPVRLAWGRVTGQEGGAAASGCSQTASPRLLTPAAGSPSLLLVIFKGHMFQLTDGGLTDQNCVFSVTMDREGAYHPEGQA